MIDFLKTFAFLFIVCLGLVLSLAVTVGVIQWLVVTNQAGWLFLFIPGMFALVGAGLTKAVGR